MCQTIKEQIQTINQQIRELVRIYRNAVGQSGISENEFWIWYSLLIIGGEYTQQDICSAWSMSKQTVNTIINNMVKKEYIFLEVVPGSHNRKLIRLTEAGRTFGEHIITPVSESEQRTIERLPGKDLDSCTLTLGKYINILKEELEKTKTQNTDNLSEGM